MAFQPNGSSTTTLQVAEYYPFGSNYLPISLAGTNNYLYNGKEKQTDLLGSVNLDWYDYGARFYDPALGRFTTIDPMAEVSRRWSPYAYCYNNPMRFIDPDGKIVKPAPGSSQSFINAYKSASNLLISKGVGGSFTQLESSKDVYYIKEDSKSSYRPAELTITRSPTTALEVDGKIVLSPTGVFGHEIEHAKNHDDANRAWDSGDKKTFQKWAEGTMKGTSESYKSREEQNVITGAEQKIAKALGSIGDKETTRNGYIGKTVRVADINSLDKLYPIKPLEPIQPTFEREIPDPKMR